MDPWEPGVRASGGLTRRTPLNGVTILLVCGQGNPAPNECTVVIGARRQQPHGGSVKIAIRCEREGQAWPGERAGAGTAGSCCQ